MRSRAVLRVRPWRCQPADARARAHRGWAGPGERGGGTGGATQPGLVTWAAGRRRWPAGVGDGNEMAGGGGGADGGRMTLAEFRPDGGRRS